MSVTKKKRKRSENSNGKEKQDGTGVEKDRKGLKVLGKEEIVEFRETNEIKLDDPLHANQADMDALYPPLTTFKESQKFFHKSCKHIFKHFISKFDKPTPIQAQSWAIMPVAKDQDFIGVAETGSGKTLAFALPAVADTMKSFYKNSKIDSTKKPKGSSLRACSPTCLVLSPTRELAIQSFNVFEEVSKIKPKFQTSRKIVPLVIYGGNKRSDQQQQLHSKSILDPENECYIVATVGRLMDFTSSGDISLEKVNYLVLDEADRMLDMGFEEQVKKIIEQTDQKMRRTVMFSATWPSEIRKIAEKYMKNPIKLSIGTDSLSANKKVEQNIIVLDPYAKERELSNLLQELGVRKSKAKVIIFALYKKESARLEDSVSRQGYKVVGLNGDKTQKAREEALEAFLSGKANILVATDVASRGLDIKDVEVVINVTFPLTIEDYVHRIGRTGRAGKSGRSFTFFTEHEKHLAGALQNVLRESEVEVPADLAKFGNTVKKKAHGMYGAHFKSQADLGEMKKTSHIKF